MRTNEAHALHLAPESTYWGQENNLPSAEIALTPVAGGDFIWYEVLEGLRVCLSGAVPAQKLAAP